MRPMVRRVSFGTFVKPWIPFLKNRELIARCFLNTLCRIKRFISYPFVQCPVRLTDLINSWTMIDGQYWIFYPFYYLLCIIQIVDYLKKRNKLFITKKINSWTIYLRVRDWFFNQRASITSRFRLHIAWLEIYRETFIRHIY